MLASLGLGGPRSGHGRDRPPTRRGPGPRWDRLGEPGDRRTSSSRVRWSLGAGDPAGLARADLGAARCSTTCGRAGHLRAGDRRGGPAAGPRPRARPRRARRRGIRFVCPGDDEWPRRIADLDRCAPLNGRGGAPLGLWVRGGGRLDRLCRRSVSVVGSAPRRRTAPRWPVRSRPTSPERA